MNEQYKLIDIKVLKSKKGKTYYYLVIYSSAEYIFKVFCTEEQAKNIKNSGDYSKFNVADNVTKSFDTETNKFRYFLKG